jgi:hypothetical protein
LKVLRQVCDVRHRAEKRIRIPAFVELRASHTLMNSLVLEKKVAKGVRRHAEIEKVIGLVRLRFGVVRPIRLPFGFAPQLAN